MGTDNNDNTNYNNNNSTASGGGGGKGGGGNSGFPHRNHGIPNSNNASSGSSAANKMMKQNNYNNHGIPNSNASGSSVANSKKQNNNNHGIPNSNTSCSSVNTTGDLLIPSSALRRRAATTASSSSTEGGGDSAAAATAAAGSSGPQQQKQKNQQRNNNNNNTKRKYANKKKKNNNNSNQTPLPLHAGEERNNNNNNEQEQKNQKQKQGNEDNNNDNNDNKNKHNVKRKDQHEHQHSQKEHQEKQNQEKASSRAPPSSSSTNNKNKFNNNNKSKNNYIKKKQQQQRYNSKFWWWRKELPKDAVDPITLDPLSSLRYPPFALAADAPYDPIPSWPVPNDEDDDDHKKQGNNRKKKNNNSNNESEEERQRRILEEQWGGKQQLSQILNNKGGKSGRSSEEESDDDDDKKIPASTAANTNKKRRHYNLFDGRALAYYMVSQLQFIDPLNRRDLTREELRCLDEYLSRHGFTDLKVMEAYEAKGITISTAGAAGNTVAGRAEILQQEAQVLLNALFGGISVSTARRPTTTNNTTATNNTSSPSGVAAATAATTSSSNQANSLMQQYRAHEAATTTQQQQQQQQYRRQRALPQHQQVGDHDIGVYGVDDSFLVIDDDVNPGLRGGNIDDAASTMLRCNAPEFVPSTTASNNTLYSANHITARYGSSGPRQTATEFPALSTTAATPASASSSSTTRSDSDEDNKNTEELHQKRPASLPPSKTLSLIGKAVKKTNPEEQQRQWEAHEAAIKKAMMSNLTFGVVPTIPANQRHDLLSVPPISDVEHVGPTEAQLERNRAFAEALDVKPSTIRQQPQFNTGWSRPHESVQELDEYGNELNTTLYPESLVLQAREHYMGALLKVERKWKAFLMDDKAASLPLNPMERELRTLVHEYSDFWKLHTESFDHGKKRYIHCVKLVDTRAPYPLLSDVAATWGQQRQRGGVQYLTTSTIKTTTATSDHPIQQTAGQTSSSVILGGDRERPKLELQKRTLPLELPPFEGSNNNDVSEELLAKERRRREEERARRTREAEEKKERLLAAAFASDDEDDDGVDGGYHDDSSDWEEGEALYTGSDDEDEE